MDTIKLTPRINTLRLLFYDLQQGELPDIASAFADQLLNSDFEQLLGPGNQISLKDLNRFIGNLRFVPEKLELFLCRKLATIDLSTLLSGSVARDVAWLQWQLLRYSRQAASIFIDRHVDSLAEIVKRSEISETFWIVWNSFQANREATVRLVSKLSPHLLSKIGSSNTTTELACLALLCLSGQEANRFVFPSKNLEEVIEAINAESHVSLAVLSLKSLSLMFDKSDLLKAKMSLGLNTINSNVKDFPIEETRKFLELILEEFEGAG